MPSDFSIVRRFDGLNLSANDLCKRKVAPYFELYPLRGSFFMQKFGSLLFPAALKEKSAGKKIAFIALFTAFSAVTNMFLEVKLFDLQFSLTVFVSIFTGVFLGPVFGFCACFLGDLVGYFVNSWGQLYFFWVGLSTGLTAFISGVVTAFKTEKKGAIYAKIAIICVLHLFVCTIAVNSTGFYLYNKAMGFSKPLLDYVAERFGGNADFFAYLCYRLFFKGQIINSAVNYALLFAAVPLLSLNAELKKYL